MNIQFLMTLKSIFKKKLDGKEGLGHDPQSYTDSNVGLRNIFSLIVC